MYRSNGLREAKRVEAEPSHDVVEGPAQRVRRLSPQQLPVFREVESAHVPAALLREVRREAVGDETADEGGAGRLGYAERPRQLGAGDPGCSPTISKARYLLYVRFNGRSMRSASRSRVRTRS